MKDTIASLLIVSVSVVGVLAASNATASEITERLGTAVAVQAPATEARPAQAESFEDPLEPLRPITGRSEEDQDRILAAAMFASGRILLNQSDQLRALERFQRAARYASDARAAVNQVIVLSQQLQQFEVAARYALLAAEKNPIDADMLARLSVLLTQQNDLGRAARLIGQAIRIREMNGMRDELLPLYLEFGRLQFLLDQHAEAAKAFDKFNQLLSENAGTEEVRNRLLRNAEVIYEMMGVCYSEAGRYDEAEIRFRKADEVKHRPGILAYRLAEVAFARKDLARTRELLDQALDQDVGEAGMRPYDLLGRWHKQHASNLNDAQRELIAELHRRRKPEQNDGPLVQFLANQLLAGNEWDQAEAILARMTATPESLRGLLMVYREKKSVEKLAEIMGTSVSKFSSTEVLAPELRFLLADKELYEGLLALIRNAHAESRKLPDGAIQAMAQLALAQKDFDTADEFFAWALEASDALKGQRLLSWGVALFGAEQPERAAKTLRRCLDENVAGENGPIVHYYLAGALALAGDADEALKHAELAARSPQAPVAFQSRAAWVLYFAKRYDEAEARYRQFLEKFGGSFDTSEIRSVVREVRLVLSSICAQQNRMAEAEEWLEKVLDEFPEDVGAMNDLGYLWADQNKRLNRALRMIEKAVAAAPDNAAYRDSLGWVYFRQGKLEESIRELEKATAVEQPDAVVLDHLAEALFEKGDREKAGQTWERALAAARRSKDEPQSRRIELKIQAKLKATN